MQEVTNERILRTIANILIVIRSTKNIKEANALADVFHNAPKMMAIGKRPEEVYRKILDIAERRDCLEIVQEYFRRSN